MGKEKLRLQLDGLLDGCETIRKGFATTELDDQMDEMLRVAIKTLSSIRKNVNRNSQKEVPLFKRLKMKQHNNTSGTSGVTFNKNAGKWQAKIGDGSFKYKHLGYFATVEEAVAARAKAQEEMWGMSN